MSSRTNREQARQRLDAIYASLRDKLIPADESVPLQGAKFIDWENQSDLIEKGLCTAFLEERAALESAAQVQSGGRCPHCSSDRVYLMKEASKVEVLSPHGPVVMPKQRCRCRSCGRTFSPSGAGLGTAGGGGTDAPGGGAGGS
jgi:DNA-directed RNA polymerase subunit RPC12/RpoP